MFILGPSSYGPNELLGLHILKTSVVHPAFEIETGAWFDVRLAGCSNEFAVEFFAGVAFFQRSVWRGPCKVEIDKFDPSAGSGVPM